MTSGDPTVLVVDDERAVADAYALRLREEYDVRTAYGGREALDAVDGGVDVVLLDRRMPDMSGDAVLNELQVRGVDCAIIMVTALEPSTDIIEMGFDDYLVKPVDRAQLTDSIERQLDGPTGRDDDLAAYVQLARKVALLEDKQSPQRLEGDDEYEQARRRLAALARRIDEPVPDLEEFN